MLPSEALLDRGSKDERSDNAYGPGRDEGRSKYLATRVRRVPDDLKAELLRVDSLFVFSLT